MEPKGQKLIGVIFDQAAVFSMNQLVNCFYIFKAGLYYQLKILVWKIYFEKISLSINFFFLRVLSDVFFYSDTKDASLKLQCMRQTVNGPL